MKAIQPDPRYPIGTFLNLTAEDLLKGQDLVGLVTAFFNLNQKPRGWPNRFRIVARVSIDGVPFRGGRLQPVTLPKPYIITARPRLPREVA